VLCPGKAYDRSPCGTGTSAKIACLAADVHLAPGATWRQESIIGSIFEASYEPHEDTSHDVDNASRRYVRPSIRGTAHVSAEAKLIFSADDPFAWGIRA
jgi:4-hydroxyproline epimerase